MSIFRVVCRTIQPMPLQFGMAPAGRVGGRSGASVGRSSTSVLSAMKLRHAELRHGASALGSALGHVLPHRQPRRVVPGLALMHAVGSIAHHRDELGLQVAVAAGLQRN